MALVLIMATILTEGLCCTADQTKAFIDNIAKIRTMGENAFILCLLKMHFKIDLFKKKKDLWNFTLPGCTKLVAIVFSVYAQIKFKFYSATVLLVFLLCHYYLFLLRYHFFIINIFIINFVIIIIKFFHLIFLITFRPMSIDVDNSIKINVK